MKQTFQFKENTNYRILDSYENEYVVPSSEAKIIIKNIFLDGATFINIKNTIIASKYIYKIEPMEEKVVKQTRQEQIGEAQQNLMEENNYYIQQSLKRKKLKLLKSFDD